jgi:peptidoglycan/xylan/chitin deacetylase (PgdA/CDA1 family)
MLHVAVIDDAHGRAQALNGALAGAGDAAVIALRDDDCTPERGWLEALQAAWATAAPDVAVIGGPIRGASWRCPALQDAPGATFHAGNASFRTAALRGAGGFWPARGHRLGRDWFAPEHEAQRELARCGWRADWCAEAVVVRAEPPLRDLLALRLRSGARGQVLGEPVAGAGRALARALAGAPFGRRAERLARAAGYAGALLGDRLVFAERQPAATSTPFLASVPAPARRRSARTRRELPTVLLYHRVATVDDDPLGLCVSPENFAQQLEVIRERVVPLADAVRGEGIAITFDDGYVDNLTTAAPLLDGLPATLFVTTGLERFWWDAVTDHLRSVQPPLVLGDRAWWPRDTAQRAATRRHVHAFLQPMRPEGIAALTEGWEATPRRMTVDELRQASQHFAIGAHTRRHPSLARLPEDEQRAELAGAADDLEAWLGNRPAAVSYPFGVPGADVDAVTLRAARAAGFSLGVVNAPTGRPDPLAVARLAVSDVDGDAFARLLALT